MTNLAEQALGSDRIHSTEEICKMVDSVTVDDVNAVRSFSPSDYQNQMSHITRKSAFGDFRPDKIQTSLLSCGSKLES